MTDFKNDLMFHTLRCTVGNMLREKIITLKDYYYILQKLSQKYLNGGISPPKDEKPKGGKM